MDKNAKEVLKQYQSEYTRNIEENFAQILSENDAVRLFFINEDRAFTDGKNIVVDPAEREIFCDKEALYRTEKWMKLPHIISGDLWMALHMVTRAQSIHETLHIIYTQFPLLCQKDKRATTKIRRTTLSMISNIIEDAYIEAVGCSVYDNLEIYLLFGRISGIFASAPSEGTVSQVFREVKETETEKKTKIELLKEYLEYMVGFLLYPMLEQEEPREELKAFVEQTKQLFLDGSICGNPVERYDYTDKIFDIIEPIIPEEEADLDTKILEKMLGGIGTHNSNQSTMIKAGNSAKEGSVTRRLTVDLEGKVLERRDFSEQTRDILLQVTNDKNASLAILANKGRKVEISGEQYDCAVIHKGIRIIESKPKVNFSLKKAYQNLYNKYHININSYNSRFRQLLKAQVAVQERKKLYGSGVDSRLLGDVKRRYWYRNTTEPDVPDIAVMLLIDGSGSMEGARLEGARTASVILHEVLKKQEIEHAIVEHRAIYDEPEVHHNILVDFHANDEEKYNILTMDAKEGTREGLSLYWAEKYMQENTTSENKLIIVLSDGVPAHGIDGPGCYVPPVSIKDTANAVRKIYKRGTNIIAIALEEAGYSCYEALREMYPYVIACTDLKKLTGQLLGLITKQLI